jgi:hypothetical protein
MVVLTGPQRSGLLGYMGWYVKRGEETVGPIDGAIVAEWVQKGMRADTLVRDEASDTWVPLTHSQFARFAPPVTGAIAVAASAPSGEGIGYAILLLPLASTMLIWWWVGQMNLLQSPSSSLNLVGVATILATSTMMAIEANSLGMGKLPVEKGKVGEPPAAWFVAGLVIWVFAFPMYLRRRRFYGRKSLAVGGFVVALVFAGSWWSMSSSIDDGMAKLRANLSHLGE